MLHAVAFDFVNLVDRRDVRMIECGSGLRFAQEAPLGVFALMGSREQDLERHLAMQAQIFRFIDLAHAARAEPFEYSVVRDSFADHS